MAALDALVATLLFILLSPGLIITIPPANKGGIFSSEATSNIAVIVHSVLFFVAAKMVASGSFPFNYISDDAAAIRTEQPDPNRKNLAKIAPIAATLLFIVLSPGLLLTLPPDEGGLFMSEDTNPIAVMVHAVIYFVAVKYWNNSLELKTENGALFRDASGHVQYNNELIVFLNEQLNTI